MKKNVARERRKAKKDPNRKKREPSGFAVPTNISSDLCDFLSVPHDTKMSRTDVTLEKLQSILEIRIYKFQKIEDLLFLILNLVVF